MNLAEIERNVAELDVTEGFGLIYSLLTAYGLPRASVTKLRSGTLDKSKREGEHLWKGKLYYRHEPRGGEDLHVLIDAAQRDAAIVRQHPRFLIVHDGTQLLAVDSKLATSLDTPLSELTRHAAFFMPWAGIEKAQLESLNYVDIKAAEKMARLYAEIVTHNDLGDEAARRMLNVFFSRLLFCFFAEDTEVFPKGAFTNAVGSLTRPTGEDTAPFLDALFKVLNSNESRKGIAEHFRAFGYVNGRLFEKDAPAPRISAKAWRIMQECGTLDWSQINPDIFGTMLQAVAEPGERGALGMQYTSVENILKVLRPLFLDALDATFEAADSVAKLTALLERIGAIRVFDPACGSGNFLVIAYKELRRMEMRTLQRIAEIDPEHRVGRQLHLDSRVVLERFYGIEIDEFAREIAVLSLWIAKHQMNVEFKAAFGVDIPLIPLKDSARIVCGNATKIAWESVCEADAKSETYVCGNPPYAGSSVQTPEQKADFERYLGIARFDRNLDYISLWFFQGAEYAARAKAELGFVSTNSACQGDHVALMWPRILQTGVEISFAHQSFPWTNAARGSAGVTCVIIGLAVQPKVRTLYAANARKVVSHISPYLIDYPRDTIVRRTNQEPTGLPAVVGGSKPTDGGHLIFSPEERKKLLAEFPEAARFLRRYSGAEDFIYHKVRYCLWIDDDDALEASEIPGIRARLDKVTAARLRGSTTAQAMAHKPHRFLQRAHQATPSIIVPSHSSERRDYIPMGFLDEGTVISNAANVLYDAQSWVFGLVQSRMHMAWVRLVAGRIKTDLRYAPTLCYNTFPVPTLSISERSSIGDAALGVVEAREQFAGWTMAQLYDPGKMPVGLRSAHETLDEAVDLAYSPRGFSSDDARLELLLGRYEANASPTAEDEVARA